MGATAKLGSEGLRTEVEAGGHRWVSDEPAALGGTNAGPTPFDLLYGALASCVAITVGMYAQRKGWGLEGVEVEVQGARSGVGPLEGALVKVRFAGALDGAQLERLTEIAGRCPVHRTLEREVEIRTELVSG